MRGDSSVLSNGVILLDQLCLVKEGWASNPEDVEYVVEKLVDPKILLYDKSRVRPLRGRSEKVRRVSGLYGITG